MAGAFGLLAACGSAALSDRQPVPAWAETLSAQREARTIEAAWRDGALGERRATSPLLSRFLLRYPEDPRATAMRLRIAWLKLQSSDLAAAERLIGEVKPRASGVDADAAEVLAAAILARRGQPKAALVRLRGIGGRLVEPETRELWAMEAFKVAQLAEAPDDAIAFMLARRTVCADEHLERVEDEVIDQLEGIDQSAKLRAFLALRDSAAKPSAEEPRHRARVWMLEAVRASLGKHAEKTNDGGMARLLLVDAPARYQRSPQGENLRRLAQSLEVTENIMHAAIGFLLELDDDRSRRQSAELVTGAMRALASLGKDESIRLITREAKSRHAEDVERAMDSLVKDGAALIIAGLLPETAALAARTAAAHRIAVVVLSPPNEPTTLNPFLFAVESSDAQVDRLFLAAASEPRKLTRLSAEDAFCRTGERLGWAPAFLTAHSEVLLTADASCALRLAEELKGREHNLRVWLGPDAIRAVDAFEDAVVVSSPQILGQSASAPVALWRERFQRVPGWYEALGYDVTRLGIEAIKRRGFDSLRGDVLVQKGRAAVRDGLLHVQADLMTTNASGFAGSPRLRPTLAVDRVRSSRQPDRGGDG